MVSMTCIMTLLLKSSYPAALWGFKDEIDSLNSLWVRLESSKTESSGLPRKLLKLVSTGSILDASLGPTFTKNLLNSVHILCLSFFSYSKILPFKYYIITGF